MRGFAVIGLLGAIGASGCLTTEIPNEAYVARRHSCPALEGRTFVSTSGDRLVVSADDTAYSTFERTNADGTVTSGLVQCDTTSRTTVLFADAADAVSGRIDGDTFTFAQSTWRLAN